MNRVTEPLASDAPWLHDSGIGPGICMLARWGRGVCDEVGKATSTVVAQPPLYCYKATRVGVCIFI